MKLQKRNLIKCEEKSDSKRAALTLKHWINATSALKELYKTQRLKARKACEREMIASRPPRPWQLSALARGSSLRWVRGQPAVAPPPPPLPPHTPLPPRQSRCGRTTMARAWPHLALIMARQSSFISPTHLAGPCRAHALRGDVWHILHSPVLPFAGWFIWHLALQICVSNWGLLNVRIMSSKQMYSRKHRIST